MSDWRQARLGEFLKIKHGYAFIGKYITDIFNKNILVTPGNFHLGGGFKTTKFKCFNGDFPSEYVLKEGDIVVTMTDLSKESDTLGYSAMIPTSRNGEKYLHNQRIGLVQFTSNEVNQDYIYWLLRTFEYHWYVVSSASGTSIMHTSPSRICNYEFSLPPLQEQQAIAEILSSLDNKIDLLHRQNQTLEQMAETLFRQWFIEEAKEDWEVLKIKDIATHKKDSVNPSKNPFGEYKHFSLPAFDSGKKPQVELGNTIHSNKYLVHENSILVSKLNPRIPRIWLNLKHVDEMCICSTEFQVIHPNRIDYLGFLFCLLKSDDAVAELEMSSSGTSGSHQRVRPEDILNLKFSTPSLERVQEFSQIIEPLLSKNDQNLRSIINLEKQRDTLLPKLMSGEVRVKIDKE
jgi:type I restriction enzyme S subunit